MFAYIPSEDPRYGFAVGRVRAREALMLTRSAFDRLLDSRTENQIISSLADTPYGETRAEDAETMLERSAGEEEAFFKRYLEDEKVGQFFASDSLASNLKFALRKHYGANVPASAFVPESSPSLEEFELMLAGENTEIPDWLGEAAGQVISRNYDKLDPASIDFIIDELVLNRQLELSRDFSFLSALLSLKVDSANLLSLIRIRRGAGTWEEFEEIFQNAGSVKTDKFKNFWDAGPEGLANAVSERDPFTGISEGVRQAQESFLLLERQLAEKQIELLLSARRLTFGYEPLIGYALLKREERRNIRRILTGLRYKLDKETVRKSIAWFD